MRPIAKVIARHKSRGWIAIACLDDLDGVQVWWFSRRYLRWSVRRGKRDVKWAEATERLCLEGMAIETEQTGPLNDWLEEHGQRRLRGFPIISDHVSFSMAVKSYCRKRKIPVPKGVI